MHLSLLVYDTLIILVFINSNLCVDDCRSCRVWSCWWVMLSSCLLTACEFTRRSLLHFSRISLNKRMKNQQINYYMWIQIHNNIGFLTLGLQHFVVQFLWYTLHDTLTCHSDPYRGVSRCRHTVLVKKLYIVYNPHSKKDRSTLIEQSNTLITVTMFVRQCSWTMKL